MAYRLLEIGNMRKGFYCVALTIAMTSSIAAHANPGTASEGRAARGFGFSEEAGEIWLMGDDADDSADRGAWALVQGIFGEDSPVALETADRARSQPPRVATAPDTVKGAGFKGALRLDLGELIVHPYLALGGGWPGYWVYIDDELNIEADDEAIAVPAGAGLRFSAGRALVDVRASYMFTLEGESAPGAAVNGSGGSWAATIRADLTF